MAGRPGGCASPYSRRPSTVLSKQFAKLFSRSSASPCRQEGLQQGKSGHFVQQAPLINNQSDSLCDCRAKWPGAQAAECWSSGGRPWAKPGCLMAEPTGLLACKWRQTSGGNSGRPPPAGALQRNQQLMRLQARLISHPG